MTTTDENKNTNISDDQIKKAIEILNQKKDDEKKKFNEGLKNILSYLGYTLSVFGAVGYLATIIIMVTGVGELDFKLMGKDGLFFILNFVFGLWIRIGLYMQGIIYAKKENEQVIKEYHLQKAKEKSKRKLFAFMNTYEFRMGLAIAINTAYQLIMLAVSSLGVVYLTGFEGIGNPIYIWNAISNLFMFAGFGLLAINSSYEKYINFKIPVLEEKTKEMIAKKEAEEQAKIEREKELIRLEKERQELEKKERERKEQEMIQKEEANKKRIQEHKNGKVTNKVVKNLVADYLGYEFGTEPNL